VKLFIFLMLLSASLSAATSQVRTIVVVGDSLASGYGLDGGDAFPELIQKKIDERGWPCRIVNEGISGSTSSSGRERISTLLKRPLDVLVLELGGNDFLRGIDPEATKRNLQAIIDATRRRHPEAKIVLIGMKIPPVIESDYVREFNAIFPDLAHRNNIDIVPFFLKGVADIAGMMSADRIHPTAAGQKVLAENLWAVLEPLLKPTAAPAESGRRGS
jgi:acyl-CoA thioesterase-1